MKTKQLYFIFILRYFFQGRLSVLFLSFFLLLATESHAADGIYAGIPRVKLTLIYHHDIFCSDECRKYTIDGCSKITGQLNKLTCREEVQLIRPKKLAELWIKKQYQQGYIDLTLKEASIEQTRAHIISITSSVPGRPGKDPNAQWVTGIFKRHALNPGDYIFKNTGTGQLSIIHATPNHGFYLKNRRAFLPVGNITEKDTLVTVDGNSVKLVKSRANTGVIDDRKANIPVWTYNLEVWQKHTYFVGSDKILVHNTCKCGICEKVLEDPYYVKVHHDKEHTGDKLSYLCGIDECTKKSTNMHRINRHQMEVHDANNPNSCCSCGRQFCRGDLLYKHLTGSNRCGLNGINREGERFIADGKKPPSPYRIKKFYFYRHREKPSGIQVLTKKGNWEVQPIPALSPSYSAPSVSDSSGDQQLDKKIEQFAVGLPDELLNLVGPEKCMRD